MQEILPGFRFHPTEQELVGFYLKRMVEGKRIACDFIPVVDLYRYDPWDLKGMARTSSENEWFFFVPRDSKSPNGGRPNRRTKCGYWKATGTDKTVQLAPNHTLIMPYGLRKTLVYYKGRAPKGIKTEWIMNEYRLCNHVNHPTKENLQSSITLCRVYRKNVPLQRLINQARDLGNSTIEGTINKPNCKLEELVSNYSTNQFTKLPSFSQSYHGKDPLQAVFNHQQEVISDPLITHKPSLIKSPNQSNWAQCVELLSPASSCVTIAKYHDDYHQIKQVINEPIIHDYIGAAPCSETTELQSEFPRAADDDDDDDMQEVDHLWSSYYENF